MNSPDNQQLLGLYKGKFDTFSLGEKINSTVIRLEFLSQSLKMPRSRRVNVIETLYALQALGIKINFPDWLINHEENYIPSDKDGAMEKNRINVETI